MLKKYKKEGMKQDTPQPVRVPTVTVCFTGLRFNVSAIKQFLEGNFYVELLYDEKGTGFGMKLSSASTEDSYEIKWYYQEGNLYSARVYCTPFVKKLGVISGIDQRDKIFPLRLDREKNILRIEFDAHYLDG